MFPLNNRLITCVIVVTILLVACGVDDEQRRDIAAYGDAPAPAGMVGSTSNVPVDFWPPPDVTVTRDKAIEIALRSCTGSAPEVNAVENPHNPVARLMTRGEYEERLGGSSYRDSSALVWVVQFEGDSYGGGITTAGGAEPPLFRYVGCDINAQTGDVQGGFRRVSEPFLLPLQVIQQIPNEIPDPNYGIIVPTGGVATFSRDDVLALIKEKYGTRHSRPERAEIELVTYTEAAGLPNAPATPIPATSTPPPAGETVTPRPEATPRPLSINRLAWLVIIPAEFDGGGCFISMRSEFRRLCLYVADWMLVDALTGETRRLPSGGLSVLSPLVTNDEYLALTHFAWAEGWWELWHQIKDYSGDQLPAGLAAQLDRPNAPRPTPYPTSTPDPDATARPTPTPAPTETAAQKALRTPTPAVVAPPAPAPTSTGNQTPDDIQAMFDRSPEEHRIKVNDDVFILFAYQNGFTDWVAPVFIYHIPSITQVLLNYDGTIISDKNVNGVEARAAVDAVLADEKLMAEIASRKPTN